MSGQIGTLGKYQIIREIARSNDIVYEAYDPVMNRRVALKELAMPSGSTAQQQEDRRNRFLRETRAAGMLSHPNIVTIYEYGEDSGRHFIAMEFLDGHTLRNELDTNGFLATDRAIEIAIEVLEGLEYAHAHGVIHRDIKPDNIQLLPDGRIKLTDFGIARLTFEPNLTMDGQVFGTPSYMSPEQVVGKEIDVRSDVFSVGVVLYEMVAGKKPFAGDSVVSITYSIMNSSPDQPAQANWALWQVVDRALEKSPQLRHATAADMRRALEAVQASAGSVVQTAPPYSTGSYPAAPAPGSAPPPNNPYVQNPYAPQPYGSANPFSQTPPPYGSTQQGLFAYNPYQGGSASGQGPYPGQPPTTGGFIVPPVYYPPPPRVPLLKPETRRFLGKLALTVLVLGTFFGLVIAVVFGLSTALQRDAMDRKDKEILRRLESVGRADPQAAIQEWESQIPRLQDPINRAAARTQLAVLYERHAKQLMGRQDFLAAEEAFLKASELDPANAAYASDLGALYGKVAASESSTSQKAGYLAESASQWTRAAQLEKDLVKQSDYRRGATAALLQLSAVLEGSGDLTGARQAVYDAMDITPRDSADFQRVQTRLRQLDR